MPDFNGSITLTIQITPSTGEVRSLDHSSLFCRITQSAYEKGVAQQVEDELRHACINAPTLVKVIRTNEALGYLDTKNLSSCYLHKLLNEHFGLSFQQRCFRYYRSK